MLDKYNNIFYDMFNKIVVRRRGLVPDIPVSNERDWDFLFIVD